MSRTSTALRRLGVAGLVAVTVGAGIPALSAVNASAATPSLTLSPTADIGSTTAPSSYSGNTTTPNGQTPATDASGRECNPFTLTVTNQSSQTQAFKVNITQATPASSTDTQTATIGFCDASNSIGRYPNPQSASISQPNPPNAATAGQSNNVPGTVACTGTNATGTQAGSTTCTGMVRLDANGQATFGVFSSRVGPMQVRAFEDVNGNNIFDPAVEASATATKNFVGGAHAGPTTADDQASNRQAVNNAVTGFDCQPPTQNHARQTSGYVTCTATGANGATVYGADVSFTVTNGPDRGEAGSTNPTNSFNNFGGFCFAPDRTAAAPAIPGDRVRSASNSDGTDNLGTAVCRVFNFSGNIGTDTVVLYPGTVSTSALAKTVSITFSGNARNIACSPSATNPPAGGGVTTTCTVRDVNGNLVPNQDVRFTLSGVGRFASGGGANPQFGRTNSNGVVSVVSSTFTNESGAQTIKAELGDFTTSGNGTFTPYSANTGAQTSQNECQLPAGVTNQPTGTGTQQQAPNTAGNCDTTVTINYQPVSTSASPTPSATSTATTSPAPTATATATVTATATATSTVPASTPPATRQKLGLTVNTPTVPAGSNASITVTGSANQTFELLCYTRPSTTYNVVRSATFDAAADAVTFSNLAIGRNTRCFARYVTNNTQGQSDSGVINARTVISLSAVRTAVRTYTFQGRNLPRASGQLITLYRVDNNGNEIRTANLVTDASGIYRVSRKFTGSGTFQFKVRTSTTLNNIAGVSNVITVVVH